MKTNGVISGMANGVIFGSWQYRPALEGLHLLTKALTFLLL